MHQTSQKNTKSHHSDAEFYANKALSCHHYNDTNNAIKYAKIAINYDPSSDRFLHILGVLYQNQNKKEKAAKYFEKAISLNTQNLIYYYNLGIVYKELGKTIEGLNMQKSALALSSSNLPCLNEIGLLYIELNQLSKAEVSLLKAYSLDSLDITTCINLSHLYILKRQLRDSIDYANKALEIDANRPEPYCNLGKALMTANFHSQGIDYLRTSLSKNPEKASFTHQSILMNMLYADCYTSEAIFNAHKNWADTHLIEKSASEVHNKTNIKKNKVLNIGFVSSDFRDHSIAYFLIPLLENINTKKFQIICYSATNEPDKITENFRQLSTYWRDIKDDNDENIVKQIKQDRIDILIDLSGHSLGTCLSVFAHKPAPIQMTYLGYPFSSGLACMDYRITDSFADPENTTEHLHTEKLARINPSFICYKPGKEIPICTELPIDKNNYITFGSFNNFAKLSKSTIRTWASILSYLPDSRILLKNTHDIPDLLRDNILSTFEEFGITPNRVVLHHPTTSKIEHMTLYNEIDICLDPFPYNGTTTTFEAIYMGVPVITLIGNAHYNRVGFSILNNLALTDLTASSHDEYVTLAKNLASNTLSLKKYRDVLRKRLLSSPITNAQLFGSKFEALLQQAWNTYCDEKSV